MKPFKEYVIEAEQNLARDLNEFAPGGDDGNSPYAYGVAIQKFADLYANGHSDISADGVDVRSDITSQNDSDAADIDQIAKAFLSKGMEAGREAYMSIDDFIQDDITGYLEDQGFNVANDIYAEYKKDMERWDNSPEGNAAARAQQEKDAEWEKGKADRDANEVVISAVNPKNPYDVQSSVLFDQRQVPAGQLRSKIEQAVANIKKELPARSADSVIQVTIGGKPINLDESTELSSILKNAGLKG